MVSYGAGIRLVLVTGPGVASEGILRLVVVMGLTWWLLGVPLLASSGQMRPVS